MEILERGREGVSWVSWSWLGVDVGLGQEKVKPET